MISSPSPTTSSSKVAIIGAGPAGLTAAWQLSRSGVPVTVFEADPNLVGGIARTVEYKGFRFDIGGHRFFSKSQEVEDLWTELLKDDMLLRPRSSRIYYQGKFYTYPLKAGESLRNLGLLESARLGVSLAYIGNEGTMRLACQTKVNGDITVTTRPPLNLFGENFFS